MPERETLERARRDKKEGKSPSTQAGEFVREEIHHVREGKHGARSSKQAIAIGLSKARRAGVKLAAPKKGTVTAEIRKHAQRDLSKGQGVSKTEPSPARSRATLGALKREGTSAASRKSLAKQAEISARKRGSAARRHAAVKAIKTKGKAGLQQAAAKAAASRTKRRRAA